MPARELQIRRDSRLLGELCADLLERGHGVQFRVHGNSMRPNLLSGEQVLVEPAAALRPGDIAFIQNQEGLRVHRVSLVSAQQTLLTRSDTAWEPDAPPTQIFGKVVAHGNNSAEMKTLTTLRTLLLHPVKIAARKIRLAAKNRFRRAASFLFGTAAILFCASLFAASAHAQADLTMTQVASVTAVAAGQSLGTATNVTWAGGIASFTFPTPLPSGVVVNASLTTAGFTPAAYNVTNAAILSVNGASGVITVSMPAQPFLAATAASWAGGVASFTFTTPLPADAVAGNQLNTTGYTPNGYNLSAATILSANNATGVVTVALATNPGLALLQGTATANPGPLSVSGTGSVPVPYTYTETVTNNGPNVVPVNTLVVYQQTPPNTVFKAITGTNWNCTTPGNNNAGPIVCTYTLALNSGSSAPAIVLTESVINGTAAGTTIQNSATVTSATVDPVPANNTTQTTIYVEPANSSDLAISLSVAPSPVFVYSTINYTVLVQNLGQQALAPTANVVQITLPTLSSITVTPPANWTCAAGTPIKCSLNSGSLAMGAIVTFAISATAPSTAQTLTASAAIVLPSDPNTNNNNASVITVVQPLVCATPGKDGAGGTLTGIVNAYYPPTAGEAVAAGATSVIIGPANAGGAQTPIAIGDLLLIIQMQAATINSTNSSSYGDGKPGDPATGSTSLGGSGDFEFVTATNAIPVTGGTLQFIGSGPTGGLLNSYVSTAVTLAQPQQTFQVIRVPQYSSATFSSTLAPLGWTGTVGGVLAIDVSSQLTLNGTVSANTLGFRGGAGRKLGGAGAVSPYRDTDYVTSPATVNLNGSKGEGIAGSPRYIAPLTITTASVPTDTTGGAPADTLPGGSYARGAPGNAGGGGTDGGPPTNNENSGGGAGGNGGSGGFGGYGWSTFTVLHSTNGGFGGAAFPASTSALVLGGSGGAGTSNDGTYYVSAAINGNGNGIFSSGAAGGGIVIIHAGSITGTGTISANGQTSVSTLQDSTGGGGAGGSIEVFSNSGPLSGLTLSANGGNAGNAWPNTAPAAFSGNRHGPGGGGGGGVVFTSAAPAGVSVTGGSNGFTTTAQDSYGATPGQPGISVNTHIITETPGTQAGAYCSSTDLSVTNVASTPVVAPGGTITYTQVATNNGTFDAVNAVFSESLPANTVLASVFTPPAGWACNTITVGNNGVLTCTNPSFTAGTSSTFNVSVLVSASVPQGTQIVSVDSITSGTSDLNLSNNSATAITTVSTTGSADLLVTNTPSASVVDTGSTITVTAVMKNQGPAVVSNPQFSENVPAGTTFGSLAIPPGWTCFLPASGAPAGSNIRCNNSTLAVDASVSFPVVFNVTGASGTTVSVIADVGSTTVDSNPTNNEATTVFHIASPGEVDLAVSASGTPGIVTVDNDISYTQAVTNNGPSIETNATFTDAIPAGTTLVSFTPPANWTCNAIAAGGTGTFTCTLNGGQTIAVGASVNFPLVVKVSSSTTPGTTIINSPSVTSTVGDPVSGNNSAIPVKTTVASPTQADVSITKSAAPEPVNVGTTLTYTLTVSNSGPAVATSVVVTDSLPSEVSYISVFSSQAVCSYAAPTVTCTISSLAVGSIVTINIYATANSFSSGSLSTNTANIPCVNDPNCANNAASSVSTIQAATAVGLSSIRAFRQVDGSMLLEWRTHEESRNLGFHIYREDSTGRHRINPSLIAGSALLLRGARPQHAAKIYHWIDPDAPANATYTIEDVDLNGARVSHGPAYPEASRDSDAVSVAVAYAHQSPLLTQVHSTHNTIVSARPTRGLRLQTPRPLPPVIAPGNPPLSLADHAAVKISVEQEGWYRVTFAQLFAAGLNPDTDTRTLHLFAEGIEQPMLLSRAAGPASPRDTMEFYGTGIDTPFSGTRVYWLVRENQSGRRILGIPSAASGSNPPSSFPFTVVREDRTLYFAALLNGENNDNFFGATITTVPVDQELVVAHVDKSASLPVTLDLALQGATDQYEHSVTVQFNGASIGTMVFSGQSLATQSFSVESSLLLEGSNIVTLTALNGDYDVSVVQSVQLHYAHTYAADDNWLRATAAAGSELHVTGFSNQNIHVFDITDPLDITEIAAKIAVDSNTYAASFALSHSAPSLRTLLIFSDDTISGPVDLAYHRPSSLDDRHPGADIVIITHPSFSASLAPLVQLRESQGHRVSVVTTNEIFDEYNFGERSAFAVRSFLADAIAHWQRKPQTVLLVGDASFDPRDYLGFGDFDFVPTRMIETAAFKTSSDDWFTDFRQTGFATIPTGRLPVRTAADADLVVAKIVNYERNRFAGSWNSQALLIADQNIDANFSLATTTAAHILPASLQVSQILVSDLDAATARSEILAALNNGSLLVNYSGHGAEQQWSFSDLFNTTDAAALTNGGRLPVYILMDCLNGFFQDVYAQSLAESLLLAPHGGAVAVWASSGFTDQGPQATMNQTLLHQFAATPDLSLGRLILEAKSGITDKDVRRSWILFGDPAMKFQIAPSTFKNPVPVPVPAGNPLFRGPAGSRCSSSSPCSKERETK
jgi:uncharacterized repeat protein (TIGR01451 family)